MSLKVQLIPHLSLMNQPCKELLKLNKIIMMLKLNKRIKSQLIFNNNNKFKYKHKHNKFKFNNNNKVLLLTKNNSNRVLINY